MRKLEGAGMRVIKPHLVIPAVLGLSLVLLACFSVTAPVTAQASIAIDDTNPPVVTYDGPNGTVDYDSPFLFGKIDEVEWPWSGIAAASISLNGSAPIPCTVKPDTWTWFWSGGWGWECPQTGLEPGHYDVVVNAIDKAGNVGETSGSFDIGVTTCVNGKPLLRTYWSYGYWASMGDYVNSILSVDVPVDNESDVVDAYNLQVIGVVKWTPNVVPLQELPLYIGNIPAGGQGVITIKLEISPWSAIVDFYMIATAEDECGNLYRYPR